MKFSTVFRNAIKLYVLMQRYFSNNGDLQFTIAVEKQNQTLGRLHDCNMHFKIVY